MQPVMFAQFPNNNPPNPNASGPSSNYSNPPPPPSYDINFFNQSTNMDYSMTPMGNSLNMSSDLGTMSSASSSSSSSSSGSGLGGYDDEPPLLEELGINFADIFQKTMAVTIPFRNMPTVHEQDSDLAGPLCFCLLLGSCLLVTGKVHFGYIYGFGVIGCLLMYIILNLMAEEAISVDRTMSILGYSLLPIVLLALLNIFFDLRGTIGLVLSIIVIGWCTLSATRLIEKALDMKEQRYLIAYPVTMLYACFALLTIF